VNKQEKGFLCLKNSIVDREHWMKIDKIIHYRYTKLLILLGRIHSEIFNAPGGVTPDAGATSVCDIFVLPV
jgi:hypothetical protein